MTTRRTILKRTIGTGALVATCGCADNANPDPGEPRPLEEMLPDLPVEERVDVVAGGIETGFGGDLTDSAAFEEALVDAGVAVESLLDDGPELSVEYRADPDDGGVLRGVGVVAGAYASLLDGTDAPGRLRATLVDREPAPFGEFRVDGEWAIAFAAGERTAEEYGVLVSDTLETIV